MLMLDLFAGLGGASRAMQEAGWIVIRVDNDPQFNPDICTDRGRCQCHDLKT